MKGERHPRFWACRRQTLEFTPVLGGMPTKHEAAIEMAFPPEGRAVLLMDTRTLEIFPLTYEWGGSAFVEPQTERCLPADLTVDLAWALLPFQRRER